MSRRDNSEYRREIFTLSGADENTLSNSRDLDSADLEIPDSITVEKRTAVDQTTEPFSMDVSSALELPSCLDGNPTETSAMRSFPICRKTQYSLVSRGSSQCRTNTSAVFSCDAAEVSRCSYISLRFVCVDFRLQRCRSTLMARHRGR